MIGEVRDNTKFLALIAGVLFVALLSVHLLRGRVGA